MLCIQTEKEDYDEIDQVNRSHQQSAPSNSTTAQRKKQQNKESERTLPADCICAEQKQSIRPDAEHSSDRPACDDSQIQQTNHKAVHYKPTEIKTFLDQQEDY
jgi:hypothetical protein